MVAWFSVRTHNAGVAGSNPARVTRKAPLIRKATRKYLTKSTSLEKNEQSCLWFLLSSSTPRCITYIMVLWIALYSQGETGIKGIWLSLLNVSILLLLFSGRYLLLHFHSYAIFLSYAFSFICNFSVICILIHMQFFCHMHFNSYAIFLSYAFSFICNFSVICIFIHMQSFT